MRRLTLSARASAALVPCAAPGDAAAAETSTTLLSQGEVALPDRSRVIDSDGRGGDWDNLEGVTTWGADHVREHDELARTGVGTAR